MNKICRILSIVAIGVSAIVVLISIIIINHRQDDEEIYATSIRFAGISRGVEICIDNAIVLNQSMIVVEPSNCTFTPIFTIQKSDEDEEQLVESNIYSFYDTGIYYLNCKVHANANYVIYDTLKITVLENLSDDHAGMYIKAHKSNRMYVDGIVDLSSVVTFTAPEQTDISIKCSEHVAYSNNKISAIKAGMATVEVVLNYDHITIKNNISINIFPKIIESNIKFKLSVGGNVLANNNINIADKEFDFIINYELLNIENQLINCWTDSDIFEIVSCDAPTIIIRPKLSGEASLYISPIDFPNTVYLVVVNID